MRWFGYSVLALSAVLLLAALALWPLSQTDMAWTWGGQRLVDFARTRIYGEIEVREVKGNYLTGLHFRDITIRGHHGEVIRAAGLDLRFSLWSFVKLQPVIAKLAIYDPHLTLTEYPDGQWNVTNLFRPKPPPPFTVIDFPKVIIERGEITLTRNGTTQVCRDLNLRLILTVLRPKQPDQSILVRQASLDGATPWGRLGLQTRFTYGSNLLNLLSLVVKKADRPLVSLGGEVRFHEAEPLCKLLGEVGPLPGKEMQRLCQPWPGAWDLGGKFQLTGTPSRMQISGEGPLPQGKYSLQGQVGRQAGEWGYDLGLELSGFKPWSWARGDEPWARRLNDLPPLTVQLKFKGGGLSWPPKNLECTLQSRPFSYRRAKVEQLRLNLTANGRGQHLQGLLKGNFGELKADATGPLLTSLSGQVKIQAEGCQPGICDLPVAGGTRLSGKFTGNFRLPSHLSGDLEARGNWGDQPLKDLKVRLTLNGPKVEIARAQGQLGSLNADLKGALAPREVDLQGRVKLTLDGTWPLVPANLRGRLIGEGTVKGPIASPRFTLKAQGQGLSWRDFALAKVSLQASGTGWPPPGGRVEIKGTGLKTPAGVFSQAAFLGQGEGGRWQLSFDSSSAKGLKAEVRGTTDLQARPRVLNLSRCRFTSPKVTADNTGPIQVRFQPGLEIPPAAWRVNDGRLTLKAQTRGRELTARLEAVDLPASLIHLKGASLAGKVQGHLDLSGSLEHPAMHGQLTWGPGKWGDFSFRALETSVNYREDNLLLKGSVEEKAKGPRLVWDGQIPLKLSFSPLKWDWGERDLNLRVQGENASLALLTALSPEVHGAEGSLSIMAQWQGNPRHPRVSGKVRWGEGKLQFRTAGKAFHLLPGEATLLGEKIVIPDLALESGGMAHLRGAVTLAGFRPHHLDIRANLQDFQALDRGGAEASASGNVSLRGLWSAPLLKGRLLVSKAFFRPSFFQTGIHEDIVLKKAPPPLAKTETNGEMAVWQNLEMDITLESPEGARIRDKRLNMILAGTLKARKKPGEPCYVSGVLRSRGGTYELHGRPFKIERGEIRFPGKPHAEVTLEGRAIHEISGLTLILNASGPAGKPQVRMESIPPLPPSDLLAYLVFGRPAQSLTREEYQTVGQQALGILGGISAQKIQEFLGKDFPLVGNVRMKGGQSEGRQTVGIAKPLTKDITVTFERKTSPLYRDDSNQVRLEYKVNKYLSLESQMGERNSGGDVLFNLDF
ncbi:MAG: translocation/assembly module TamB [Syntrophales bacterium]|nr:translocation/assembly module TamB [Syntrophales bacterium]MDD5640942.1 translocation/assembly module TamB [Syntrophales bacterium]